MQAGQGTGEEPTAHAWRAVHKYSVGKRRDAATSHLRLQRTNPSGGRQRQAQCPYGCAGNEGERIVGSIDEGTALAVCVAGPRRVRALRHRLTNANAPGPVAAMVGVPARSWPGPTSTYHQLVEVGHAAPAESPSVATGGRSDLSVMTVPARSGWVSST